MDQKHHSAKKFYGATTLGEKGQVVIPAEARKDIKIKTGEKLLVFGLGGHQMLVLAKLADVEKIASHLADQLKVINKIIKRKS